jgi:hypothetical protein
LQEPGKIDDADIDGQHGCDQKNIGIADEKSLNDGNRKHEYDEIFYRQFAYLKIEEMEKQEEEQYIDHRSECEKVQK